MGDDVEMMECGEIVAHGESSDLWADPRADGMWGVYATRKLRGAPVMSDVDLTSEQLATWCRRVLREVDPDPVPTVDEAAIRADERAKVEAEVLDRIEAHRRHARTAHLRHVRTVPGAAFTVPASGVDALDGLAEDIRAGKHRSTP